MADRLSEAPITSGHNSKSKMTIIRESMERLYRLDAEIDGLIEEHVKELREQKSEIKARLREEFNMPAKLVQARYSSYRLERAAEEASDNETLDAIREMFRAMPIGGQPNFLDALDETDLAPDDDDGPTPEPNDRQANAIRLDGRAAAELGKRRKSGYSKDSRADGEWKAGFDERKDEMARSSALSGQEAAGTA